MNISHHSSIYQIAVGSNHWRHGTAMSASMLLLDILTRVNQNTLGRPGASRKGGLCLGTGCRRHPFSLRTRYSISAIRLQDLCPQEAKLVMLPRAIAFDVLACTMTAVVYVASFSLHHARLRFLYCDCLYSLPFLPFPTFKVEQELPAPPRSNSMPPNPDSRGRLLPLSSCCSRPHWIEQSFQRPSTAQP